MLYLMLLFFFLGKLKEEVSMKRVLGDIREDTITAKTFDRLSLTNTKDLHNIKSKIPNSEKKKIVFKTLKTLRDETSLDNFNTMLVNILKDLDDDEETKAFGKYFLETLLKPTRSVGVLLQN